MDLSIVERLSVVEVKLGGLTTAQNSTSEKVDKIYDYVVSQKAEHRMWGRILAGIAGFAAFCGTLWEIFGPFTKKS